MKFAENIKKEIILALVKLKSRIIENHLRAGQKASGRTIRSLLITETDKGAKLTGRKPFATLETGRKAGKVPRNFYEIIKQWVIDKGMAIKPKPYKRQASAKWQPKYNAQQRGLMSLSGAIANKIAKKGTSLHRQGGRKDIYSEPTDETIKAIREKLTGIFKTEITRL